MASTPSSRIRAVQILPTGHLHDATVPAGNGDAIRELIGCRAFDVVGLNERIDLWVDDEGAVCAEPVLNLPATVLAHPRGADGAVRHRGGAVGGLGHGGVPRADRGTGAVICAAVTGRPSLPIREARRGSPAGRASPTCSGGR